MSKVFVLRASLGGLLILCQWLVFVSVRKYLFARYASVSRAVAYPVLLCLTLFNIVAILISFSSFWLPLDSWGRKVVNVLFFTYLGLVLVMCLQFLLIGAVSQALSLKDWVLAGTRAQRSGSRLPGRDQRGFVGSLEAEEWGKHAISPSDASTPLGQGSKPVSAGASTKDAKPEEGAVSPSRRSFLKWTAAAGIVTAVGCVGRGIAEGYQAAVIEELDYEHPLLNGLEKPITLIHITDLHFGLFIGTSEIEKLVDRLNAMDGDALVITGDVFHSRLSPVELATPLLKKLKPRKLGNFAVLGNHDFYAGERRSVDGLRRSGITVLRGQWIELRQGDFRVHLGGIDDPRGNWMWGRNFPAFRKFLRKVPVSRAVRVLLSHRPSILPFASRSGIDLVLAGHIHGGQIIFPIGWSNRGVSLASIVSPYTYGWYSARETRMYLNRGIGLTCVPWRINCPPEIAVIRLKGEERKQV
jgi:predicted MPP superfamily phosphohydrolase